MPSGQRHAPSRRRLRNTLLAAVLAACGCSHGSPGVLTLAPAGMRTTGACVSEPDGTVTMPAGATASAVVYVDAGAVTITVTGTASSLAHHPEVELWVAGDRVATLPLQSTTAQALPFHVHARSSGPTALRIAYVTDNGTDGEALPTLHLEKVVITEP